MASDFQVGDFVKYVRHGQANAVAGRILDKFKDVDGNWYIFRVTARDHPQYYLGTELQIEQESPHLYRRVNYHRGKLHPMGS